MELDPGLGVAYFNRATVMYRMGKFSEALKDFETCLDKEPDNLEYKAGLDKCKESLWSFQQQQQQQEEEENS